MRCSWVPTRWQSNEEKLPEEATVSYNFNQLSGLDRMGRAAVEKSVQKLVFFRALHQTCKSYLWVHQKVKSIFILWDSFSFCSEQPREKNSFCLVWVWELVQQSDTQSEDWALILECYKKKLVFFNIKVFSLATPFPTRSTSVHLSGLPWAAPCVYFL